MADIQEYYEEYWQNPDAYDDPTTPQRHALLRRHLVGVLPEARILDAGCGRGEFCQFFSEMGFQAEGIDISRAAIDFARRQRPEITFHTGELDSLLPERAGEFDCVFSSEVIEHLFDVRSYLKAAHALLKPGGHLIVTTPYHGLVKNIIIDLLNYEGHYDPTGQHIRFFNQRSLSRCLSDSGFAVEQMTGYGRPWPFWKSFFAVAKRV